MSQIDPFDVAAVEHAIGTFGADPGDEEETFDQWAYDAEDNVAHTVPNLGAVKVAENYGGEGLGEEFGLVFEVVVFTGEHMGVHFYQKHGWYSSYDGGYYDGEFVKVYPREVTVTKYFLKP